MPAPSLASKAMSWLPESQPELDHSAPRGLVMLGGVGSLTVISTSFIAARDSSLRSHVAAPQIAVSTTRLSLIGQSQYSHPRSFVPQLPFGSPYTQRPP